jgi:hypothetical protein
VVGAVNAGPAHAGAVYVFVRSGTTWTQQARLAAADGAALDHFYDRAGLPPQATHLLPSALQQTTRFTTTGRAT